MRTAWRSSWWLAACAMALTAWWAVRHVDAGPATERVVLNPARDTFLGQGIGAPQDTAIELQTGWVYTTRGREFRTYLEFPLDPEAHPPDGLLAAELWLYPEGQPQSSQIAATFVVRTMTEPFSDGRIAPSWFSAGEPVVEMMLDRTMDWKVFSVRDHVLEMLRAPDRAHGFEISGKEMRDNTRWDFLSREGDRPYPDGRQPRLVLFFRDGSIATRTPEATAGPPPTDVPSPVPTAEASATPQATMAATETIAATFTPTVVATTSPTGPPAAGPLYLPRALSGR